MTVVTMSHAEFGRVAVANPPPPGLVSNAIRRYPLFRLSGRTLAFQGNGAMWARMGICLIGAVCLAKPVLAQSVWHVDGRSAKGDGRSWMTAWPRFTAIDWTAIQPGDTLLIACGTYRESLLVKASGRPGQPITIAASKHPGMDDPVVIDGENIRPVGVQITGQDHLVISGLSVRRHAGAGIAVRSSKDGVVIEGNRLYSGDPGAGNARGIDVRNSAGVVVRANSYTTPGFTRAQTDGIWSSGNRDVLFEGNRISISNSDTSGHSDGIQSFQDYRITIRNNLIAQANLAATDNHGMWISNTREGGLIKVENNIVLAPNLTRDSAVSHWHAPGWTERGQAIFTENTIIGGRTALSLRNAPLSTASDNILLPASGGRPLSVSQEDPPD